MTECVDKSEMLPQKYAITTVQKTYNEKPTDFKALIKPLYTLSMKSHLTYFLSNMPLFTSLREPTDINVFKCGISPLWEDEANLAGGKYIIKVKKEVGQRLFERLIVFFTLFDKDQENTNIKYENEFPPFLENVNGIVGSLRGRQVMLSVWMRSVPEDKEEVVKDIRKILGVNYDLIVEFKDNDESLKDNSSFRNTAIYGAQK